jgi:AcrR family transcriptional regulator
MVLYEDQPLAANRRRGRPVGSNSAATRGQILRAARQVINQRGYQAATFQAISLVAGLSRPTLHYYYSSREEIFAALVDEADLVMAGCLATARREDTLVARLSALAGAIREADVRDHSQIAFLISASLESTRIPELRAYACAGVRDFLTMAVDDAKAAGELPAGTEVAPVVDMLHAIVWGVGFYSGFIDNAADLGPMTRQLDQLFTRGILGGADASGTPGDT